MKHTKLLIVALGTISAGYANAGIQYLMNYTFTMDQNYAQDSTTLTDFIVTNQYSNSSGFTDGPWDSLSPFSSNTLSDPFPKNEVPTGLLIGIATNLPGDASGQQHIVLGMDNSAAGYAANIAWGTLFRNTDEDVLIGDLQTLYNPNASSSQVNQAVNDVFSFMGGDASNGILDNHGNPISAYFSCGTAQNLGGSFTMMSWSNGTVIGSGTVNPQAVPEPSEAAVLGIGLISLVGLKRKKR